MKVQINKEVELCDLCRGDGFLQTCIRCQKRFCLVCDALISGCIIKPRCCKECGNSEKVKAICDEFAPSIHEIRIKRDQKIEESI